MPEDKKPGYEYLTTYILASVINELNFQFCRQYIKSLRQREQMEQASRSNKSNIAEGCIFESLETYIKLLGTSRGSVVELGNDYLDFLLQNKLQIWPKDDPKVRGFRGFRAFWVKPNIPNTPNFPNNPEEAANMILTFCQMESYLLKRQIESLREKFIREGGFRENLFKKRLEYRLKTK